MLHVLNGDATATVFAAVGLPGDVLVWRDILVEGPVTPEWPAPDALTRRATVLAARLSIAPDRYRDTVREQEDGLAAALEHDEIVLWFEQDLFCAVNLWSVLAWLERHAVASRLTLVYPSTETVKGLGVLGPAQMGTLFGERQPVTPAALTLGRRAWDAYASDDPRGVERLVDQDSGALPFVREALWCHRERFPSVRTGLNEIEAAILATLDGAARGFGDLFGAVTGDPRVRPHGMGDLQLAAYVRALAPLVNLSSADVMTAEIALAPVAREVTAGRRDWPGVRGLDVWLGGVHLHGDRPRWRWDGARRRLVEPAAG